MKATVAESRRALIQQELENRIIDPGDEVGQCEGTIQCQENLGGMLRYYYRDAA